MPSKTKGGSIASDAVTSLVNDATYKQMNEMFSNEVNFKSGGGSKCNKCGGKLVLKRKKSNSRPKTKKTVKGGFTDMIGNTTHEAFASTGSLMYNAGNTYQKFDSRLPGNATVKTGGNGQKLAHLSELVGGKDAFRVLHKKSGGAPLPKELGYNVNFYSINNKLTPHPPMTSEQNKMISNMDLGATSALLDQKTVQFAALDKGLPFSFGQSAGKAKKTTKKTTKKQSTSKKTTSAANKKKVLRSKKPKAASKK